MKIILVEFAWQVNEIVNANLNFKDCIIVSLDPESSYILKTNNIPYFETYNFCKHEDLWAKYNEIVERTFKITKILDDALWDVDKRYKDLNWKFFDDYHYNIKNVFDQLFYYAELISELIKRYDPKEILIADTSKIDFNEYFVLSENYSLFRYLLKNFEKKIKVSYMVSTDQKAKKSYHGSSFGQPRYLLSPNNIRKKINAIYYKTVFLFGYFFLKPKYLSIGCFEVIKMKRLFPNITKDYLCYYHENFHYNNNSNLKNNEKFFEKFKDFLNRNNKYQQLISHKDIDFSPIFDKMLRRFSSFLNFYVHEYFKAKKIIKKINPNCLIFQSMTPMYSANITFRKVCVDLKIPYVTWVHGGYGTYSLWGYDVCDFRLCINHISYGEYLNDLVKSDKCILKSLGFHKNHKIFPIGSFRFDYDNKKKNIKKINEKPTIVFMLGALCLRNQYYFGYNRPKVENSLWFLHFEILLLLKEYQNRYNIIFKDYPLGKTSLWKKVLKDINANKITYITKEKTVNNLLRISDLNILPWLSTTFYEALYFDADIFLLEEDLFDEPFKNKLDKEIFWFKNAEKFKTDLKKYLEVGKFYQRTKHESKKYFLNLNTFKNKADLLNTTLNKIT